MSHFLSSLRFRLLLLVLLALLPSVGLVIYTASEQRRLAAIQAQENALRLARASARSQEQLIGEAQQLLMVLAQIPAVRDRVPTACTQMLDTLLKDNPRYTSFSVIEYDGSSTCYAVPPTDNPTHALPTVLQGVVEQAFETRNLAVSGYGVGPYSKRRVLGFAYPILDEARQSQAVVTTMLDVVSLNDLAAQSLLPPGSTLTANDRNGTILARYPDPEKWVGRSVPDAPIFQTILSRRDEGTTLTSGEDGVMRLYAFTPLQDIPGTDIYVSVGIPTTVAFAEADQILTRNLIALGLVAVLTLGAAWISSDLFVLRQVRDLLGVTGQLADGDLSARTGLRHGTGELDQLAHAFDRMVAALEQREMERKQATEQVRRQAARAEALVQVAERLNAQLDLKGVLQAICEETVRALHIPAASVQLYDEGRNAFNLAANCGLPSGYAERVQPLSREIFDQSVLPTGATLILSGTREFSDPSNTDLFARLDIRTVVQIGMLRDSQPVGVLSIFTFGQAREFSDDEQTLLKGLATQAALAITNARLFEALQREEHTRAELLHRVITAQEDERMRIARELHDETGHSLTTLIMGLDTARLGLTENIQKVDEYLQTTKCIAEEMFESIHCLVEDLRPHHLDVLGLVPAIGWCGEQRLNPLGIALHLDTADLLGRLAPTMEVVLFRIVQEALSNVARHAQATEVNVVLAHQDGHVILQIADNGQGFDPDLMFQEKSFGLRGMRERVNILGGEFRLQSARGKGTLITVRVPIPRKEVTCV